MARVLIIEDDPNIADLARVVLTDEGYQVSVLNDTRINAVQVAIGQLEPDCVLLDGDSLGGQAGSRVSADWLSERARPVPTIVFSAHHHEADEAQRDERALRQDAGFNAVMPKPFNLDELLETVARCAQRSAPFDRSEQADADRTAALVEKLWAAGARDIRPSTRREWAQFRTAGDAVVLVYWSQRDGVYYVMRHAAGGRVERVGQFYDRDAAIALAATVTETQPGTADDTEEPTDRAGPSPSP